MLSFIRHASSGSAYVLDGSFCRSCHSGATCRIAVLVVRHILEELMKSMDWPVYSPFAKEHFGRGKEEGRAEGMAQALLAVLAIRGIRVPESARTRICACRDIREIESWLERAAVAESIDELLD